MKREDVNVIVILRVYTQGIHTFTSSDITLYVPFKEVSKAEEFIKSRGITKSVQDRTKYTKGDEKLEVIFIQTGLDKSNFNDIDLEISRQTRNIYLDFYEYYQSLEDEKKRKQGFVNYTYPMKPEEVKGSLTFLFTPEVKQYISTGIVWGYLGHSYRQHYMDEYIEYTIKRVDKFLVSKRYNVNTVDVVAEWMRNSMARHWMDSIEDENRNVFKRKFKKLYIEILSTPALGLPKEIIIQVDKMLNNA